MYYMNMDTVSFCFQLFIIEQLEKDSVFLEICIQLRWPRMGDWNVQVTIRNDTEWLSKTARDLSEGAGSNRYST
jgi:hypothetical protein